VKFWKITITRMDGHVEVIPLVTKIEQYDNVIHLYQDNNYGHRKHLGSFPIGNIFKWVKERQ
jgi:hypothetical protein